MAEDPSLRDVILHMNQLTEVVNNLAQNQPRPTPLARPDYFDGVPKASILASFFSHHGDLAVEMLERSEKFWLITDPEGLVLWANEAFCKWIGYSIYEFTRTEKPVTWRDITYQDESLKADIELAKQAEVGTIKKYHVKKFYIPKGSDKVFVELFVRRYPPEGDYSFFVVEVTPLVDGTAALVEAYERLVYKTEGEMTALTEAVKALVEMNKKNTPLLTVAEIKESIRKYPIRWIASSFFALSTIMGPRFFEIVSEIKKLLFHG